MAIRVRVLRGTLAQIQAATFPAGQLVMATDTKQLFMGDGATVGNILVGLSQAAVQALIDATVGGLKITNIQGLTEALAGKASAADVAALTTALGDKASKAELADLKTIVDGKVTQAQVDSSIAGKADKTAVDALATEVDGKADQTAVDSALALKADKSALDTLTTEVGTKADADDVTAALATKADQTALDSLTTEVGTKAKQSDLDALATSVGTKASTADVTAGLDKKVDKTALFDNGIIKSELLPSYVDDVLEFANKDAFPAADAAETGKIYVAIDTSKIYRWSGSTYIDLASPEILAIASDAETKALSINDKAVSPAGLGAVVAMLGFKQEGDDWVLDEGSVA